MRYVPIPLAGRWAVKCENTDELLRGWRAGHAKLIWRGTEEEATALAALLTVKPAREELSQSQRIHYMNVSRRKKSSPAKVPTGSRFHRCDGCGTMVKQANHC